MVTVDLFMYLEYNSIGFAHWRKTSRGCRMERLRWFIIAAGLFVISAIVLIASREFITASASAPTRVAEISRIRAIEITKTLTTDVVVSDVLELPRLSDKNYKLVDDLGNTARVIVADLEKAASDWHQCKTGDRVTLEVRDFPVVLPGQDPSTRESLAWFLKPTCTR